MNLIIDNYGAKIEVEAEQFKISLGDITRLASPMKLTSINILKPTTITTPALILAAKHQVPVLIYNSFGKVEVWLWSATHSNIADVRKAQAYFCDSNAAMEWVKDSLQQKMQAQIQCLQYLRNRITGLELADKVRKTLDLMDNETATLNLHQDFAQIRGWEGNMAKQYWETLHIGMQKYTQPQGRVQQNPSDILNAALNYGYGILYGIMESSLLMVGLDPYMGIMHTNRYQQPALAFDHIEPFRPWVDKLVLELIITHQIADTDLELNEEKLHRINKKARVALIDSFFALMEERAVLNGKKIKRIDHIHHASKELVLRIKQQQNVP